MPRTRPPRTAQATEPMQPSAAPRLARAVIDWQLRAGRHGLPWQGTRDPYRIWLSEIMLQQTQVSAVLGYYGRFLERFPTLQALAAATLDDVLPYWAGLGYYSRARNLHRCAQEIAERHGGHFPQRAGQLAELPGIGRSTAAAIAAFAFGERAAILDGNVKRVLCRVFGIDGFPGDPAVERLLWQVAERELPADGVEAYTQGLMDLGATVCTRSRPACGACPLAQRCVAQREGRQASLPAPRPRRSTPLRHAALLVVRCDGAVLLHKRPAPGIWGGLWSLPQTAFADAAADHEAIAALAGACGAEPPFETIAVVSHAFTHFRLQATVVQATLAADAVPLREPGERRWLPLGEAGTAALPQPVRTLLLALAAADAPDGPAAAGGSAGAAPAAASGPAQRRLL